MAEKPHTVTVGIGIFLTDLKQCSNCKVYWLRLENVRERWYCRSCKRDLTRQIKPHEMDCEEQEHGESIDPGRDASGRAQLRGADWSGTARANADEPPRRAAVGSGAGAPGDRERRDAREPPGAAGAAGAREFTDTQ